MFRTIIASAAALSVNAIRLHEEAAPVAVIEKVIAGEFTKDEIVEAVKDLEFDAPDIDKAINWAAEEGVNFEDVEAMIEGAE